jgi:hypothetical protein
LLFLHLSLFYVFFHIIFIKEEYLIIGKPIGISFVNGQGTSGVLCGTSGRNLLVIEYLYQDQFAIKQPIHFYMIQDINGFPPCQSKHPHEQQVLY